MPDPRPRSLLEINQNNEQDISNGFPTEDVTFLDVLQSLSMNSGTSDREEAIQGSFPVTLSRFIFGNDSELANDIVEFQRDAGDVVDAFSKGVIDGAVPVPLEQMGITPDDTSFVSNVANIGGQFVGFIAGAPMKIGTFALGKLTASEGGKKFFDWFGRRVGPRASRWLQEGLGLGVASAVAADEGFLELLDDPSFDTFVEDAQNRAVGLAWGGITGARYGFVRDTFTSPAVRAGVNLAITNATLQLQSGGEASMEDILFNSFMDIFFSKNGRRPSRREQQHIKEYADEVVHKHEIDTGVKLDDDLSTFTVTEQSASTRPNAQAELQHRVIDAMSGIKDNDLIDAIKENRTKIDKSEPVNGITLEDRLTTENALLQELSARTGGVWKFDSSKGEFIYLQERAAPDIPTSKPNEPGYTTDRLTLLDRQGDNTIVLDKVTGEITGNIQYFPRKKRIAAGGDIIFGPEFALRRNPIAQRLAGKIIEGQEFIDFQVNGKDEVFFRNLEKDIGRSKAKTPIVRSTIERIYENDALSKMDPDMLPPERQGEVQQAKDNLTKLKQQDPQLFEAAEKLITYFGDIKLKVKETRKAMWEDGLHDLSTERMAQLREAVVKYESGELGYKQILNSLPKKQAELFKDYARIDFWGINDFITNIERGTYKVRDPEGNTLAIGLTRKEAEVKAQVLFDTGSVKKGTKLAITQEANDIINPTAARKNALRGEDNLFDSLRSYSRGIHRMLVLEPLEARVNRSIKNNESHLNKEEVAILRRQMQEVRGTKRWEDAFVDSLVESFKPGGRPGRASRAVAGIRQAEAVMKLGFRAVGGMINFAHGHMHTYAKVGGEYMWKGNKFLRTAEGKEFAKIEEPYMGISFGEFKVSDPRNVKNLPLLFFSAPERHIRMNSLASNYLMAKERFSMSDKAAREYAHRSMRAQSFVYNTAALGRIFRSPTGKLLGQFKTYLVQEAQFVRQLSGVEWIRYLGSMLALGGPQALLHTMKSLPFLDGMEMLDDIELALASMKIGGVTVGFGIPGMLGVDTSISSAVQLPSRPEEWFGPFVSDMLKVYQKLKTSMSVSPGEAFGIKELKDADGVIGKAEVVTNQLSDFVVAANYLDDILQGMMTEPDADGMIWIKDKRGDKLYPLHSNYDFLRLGTGARPIERSRMQTKLRVIRNGLERRRTKMNTYLTRVIRTFSIHGKLPSDINEELTRLGFTNSQGIVDKIKRSQLDPMTRAQLVSGELDKIITMDAIYMDDNYNQLMEQLSQ